MPFIKAAAIPYIAAASALATVATGVIAYQAEQTSADLAQAQAEQQRRLAQQQIEQQNIQIEQQRLQTEANQLSYREADVQRRRKAGELQRQAQAKAAARGFVALPVGSFGAILRSGEEDLYRDLEASRQERLYNRASGEMTLASLQYGKWADYQTMMMRAEGYEARSRSQRLGSYSTLLSSLSSASRLWPTEEP